MTRLLVAILLLSVAATAPAATTHYISKSAGSDTNNGTSKGTPWQHLKGMASCSSNCASYSPVAGDQFILMGCDVWTPSDFPVSWDSSGTSGNPIYIGVDQTWFNSTNCPSGWNRPVFDGQNTLANDFFVMSATGSASWVTLDWIEMKRVNNNCEAIVMFNPTLHFTISNAYIHAWHTVTDTNGPVVRSQAGNLFTTGVIDGSDSTPTPGVTCNYFYPTPPDVTNSVLHDMPNGLVGYADGGSGVSTVTWAGNSIYNINDSNGGSHGNAIETVAGGTYYIHDNLIHTMGNCPGCESMFIGNTGETDYVWNNVIYDLGGAQTPSLGPESGGTSNFWNNTIVKSSDNQSCINNGGQGAVNSTIHVKNVHCIQAGAGSVADFTDVVTSLQQSVAQANANSSPKFDQYTLSNIYTPQASTNSTVGTGTNLTANCTGNNAGLCSDIVYYKQVTINGVVQAVPARTANVRPSSGAWDVGAYEFASTTPLPNSVTGVGSISGSGTIKITP